MLLLMTRPPLKEYSGQKLHGCYPDNKTRMEDKLDPFPEKEKQYFDCLAPTCIFMCNAAPTITFLSIPVIINANATFFLEWPCVLYLKYCSDPFNYKEFSGGLHLAAPVILLFVIKLCMHSGMLFVLPYERHTFDSWPTPQVRSPCNWT